MAPPSALATIERAHSLANDAVRTVALQRRRLRGHEPEDDTFVFRWWADLQFMIVALRRLRRAAQIASKVPWAAADLDKALQDFDRELSAVATMRNVGEHIDEYALDSDTRHHKNVDRTQLLVGAWNGTVFEWLGHELDIDKALAAAETLYGAIRAALHRGADAESRRS